MLVSALVSMWVSNTAPSLMMLPIATSVIGLLESRLPEDQRRHIPSFSVCVLLAVAYAASIGGVGTLIGTPPNLVLATFAKDSLDVEIGMARWLWVGLPMVAIFLPVAWVYLTRVAYPVRIPRIEGGRGLIRSKPEVCPTCNGIGYVGQTGCFGVFPIEEEEKQMIAAENWTGLRTAMRKRSLPSVQQAALRKAVEGITSIEEVSRISPNSSSKKSGGSSGGGKPASSPKPQPTA